MKNVDQKMTMAPGHEGGDGGRVPGPRPEPPFLQFLHLLWRRKLLIAVGSLLPAVLAAVLLSLSPRKYTATFVYEHPFRESEYNVLVRRFHSRENLAKIAGQLRDKGLETCAQELLDCRTEDSLEKLIRLTASPAYPKRLQTTDPATSEKISAFQAQLLSIRIIGRTRKDVETVAGVVTADFEYVLPVYAIRNDLKDLIRRFKSMAADIEDNRFNLNLDLQTEQARLEKLKAVEGPAPGSGGETGRDATDQDKLVLQFTDVRSTREFLPLAYQVRAVQSKIIDLQQTIQGNEDRYNYYIGVLELADKLFSQVEQSILTHYTTQQFLGFVAEQLPTCKDKAQTDFLKAYMRRTENLVFVSTRAGENPVIYPVSKHVAGISAIVWIASLMVVIFAAVVLESPRGPSSRDAL
jgi:hypothetical protein